MKAKKSLGQNFLINQNIIKKISNTIKPNQNDLIIEIGPGMGALTTHLQDYNCNMLCYEIDSYMDLYLKKIVNEKTKVIYKDVLKSDIKNDIKDIEYKNLYIIGNLPYYITTPIIKYLIKGDLNSRVMVFMIQEEVANRFSANPNNKEYGSITLYLKYYFNIKKLFKVSKYSFNPIPKVESMVISLEDRKDKPNVDKEKYFKLIDDSFKMKRKTLKNNLKHYDWDTIKKVLEKHNLNENTRAEQLSEEIFIDICNNL